MFNIFILCSSTIQETRFQNIALIYCTKMIFSEATEYPTLKIQNQLISSIEIHSYLFKMNKLLIKTVFIKFFDPSLEIKIAARICLGRGKSCFLIFPESKILQEAIKRVTYN